MARTNARVRVAEQRKAQQRIVELANKFLANHENKMLIEATYYGEVLGEQTCVEDRRTGSVSFSNRHVSFAWALTRVEHQFGDTVNAETVADFLSGYQNGYVAEMREEEF